jgi:hypothetical protein
MFLFDAVPLKDLFYYDRKAKRYRDAMTKRFISKSLALELFEWFLSEKEVEFKKTGRSLREKPGDLSLQIALHKRLKDVHLVNAILGKDGVENLTEKDYLDVANILKAQYGLTDNKPTPYGLKYLIQDLKEGKVSEPRLDQRLDMYNRGGEISRNTMEKNLKKEKGLTEAKRILGSAHKHCDSCLTYASWGWVGIDRLIPPKTRCECLTNCVCTVQYR